MRERPVEENFIFISARQTRLDFESTWKGWERGMEEMERGRGRKDEFHYTQEGPRAIPKDLVLLCLGPEHYQTIFRMFRVF